MTEPATRFLTWKKKHIPGWPDKSAFRVWAATERLTNEEREVVWQEVVNERMKETSAE